MNLYLYGMGIQYPLPENTLWPPLPQIATDRSFGHFRLAGDQALIVTTRTGGGSLIELGLGDVWMVSLPYWDCQTSLNSRRPSRMRTAPTHS